jgi:hypothetical protein
MNIWILPNIHDCDCHGRLFQSFSGLLSLCKAFEIGTNVIQQVFIKGKIYHGAMTYSAKLVIGTF